MNRFVVIAVFTATYLLVPAILFADEDRPNIVWIMSEDNSKHYLKLFDDAGAETPNIAALAKHGITFERAFSNAPVCSVARTSLITMVYAPRLGTQFHRKIKPATMPAGWRMFPALLRESGYYTTNNSKKDYNAVEADDVWDESSKGAHWRNRPEGKPFFHVQTFKESHESSLHFGPDWVQAPDHKSDPETVSIAPYHPDTPLFRLTYARYHDRIQVVDRKVGELMNQLESDGLLENTFVFYFGDHGGVLPRSKGYVNETGLHVPLVVRVPEKWKAEVPFTVGKRTRAFVEFVDFGPTVLRLANVVVPSHVDGKPFLGAGITNSDLQSRNETLGYADRMDEKYDLCRSIRRGKWKYIRNYQAIYPDGLQNNYRYLNLAWTQWRSLNQAGKLNEVQSAVFRAKPAEQLFDLESDPHEVVDLSRHPHHQEIVLQLRSALSAKLKSMPDLSFFPESVLVSSALDRPIGFGLENKRQIARYVDIADLALLTADEALPKLQEAIDSADEVERYWAYSVCSIFGERARAMVEAARTSAATDPDLLVRLRAAEFLGLIKEADPFPVIRDIFAASDSPVVDLIALQTFVLFKDGAFEYDPSFDPKTVRHVDEEVMRRVGYLEGLSEPEIRQQMRQRKQQNQRRTKAIQ